MRHIKRTLSSAAAALLAAGIVGAAPEAAHASTPPGAVLTLQLLGLSVVDDNGYVAASGPAALVHTAAALFATTGDVAAYTGHSETGTGYLVLTGDPKDLYVVAILPQGVTISSVENNTTDGTAIYDNETGRLDAVENPETTSDIPSVDAETVTGNVVQVPVEIPTNVCGNTINVVGLLNPTTGNVCVNR